MTSGRRRIVALGVEQPSDYGAATPRYAGYLQAHADHDVRPDPTLSVGGSAWTRAEGAAVIQQLIDSPEPFDAVFAFNDALALGALRALQSSGRHVPTDVALVGFDDTQDARYSTPTLSSVSPNLEDLANHAVGMLVDRIEGLSSAARDIEVGFHLEVRESSA